MMNGVVIEDYAMSPQLPATFISQSKYELLDIALTETKQCIKCGETKSLTEFHNNKYTKDGKRVYCKTCVSEYGKRYRTTANGVYSSLRGRTVFRNKFKDYHDLRISRKEFVKWYNSQEKKCVYCGVPEDKLAYLTDKFNERTPRLTIDCMNNNLGYVKGNLVLSCWRCNALKSDVFTFDEMREIGEKYLYMKWNLDLDKNEGGKMIK